MATVDTNVNELVINKLTQAQYDALTEKSPTELYFITDVDEEIADSIQVVEIPEIDDLDVGKIVQYVGETTSNYVNGYFYKLSLDASNALYVDTENMWLPDHTVTVVNANKLRNKIPNEYLANEDTIFFYYDTFENGSISAWACDLGRYDFFGPLTDDEILNDYGISIIKNGDTDPNPGDYFNVAYVAENETHGWQQIDVQPSSGGSESGSQVAELPEVTVDNLGTIVQYIGETTADYTNGYFYKSVEDYIAPVYNLAGINPPIVQIIDDKAFFKFVEDTIRSQGFDGLPLNIGLYINIMFDPTFAEDGKYPVVIISDDAAMEFQVFFDKDYLLHGIGLSNHVEDFSEAVDISVRVTEPSSTILTWKQIDIQPAYGDYLPLSGGTLAGSLVLAGKNTQFQIVEEYSKSGGIFYTLDDGLQLYEVNNAGVPYGDYRFANKSFSANSTVTLGTTSRPWSKVFAQSLNNGTDIVVPTTGGTMVVATPPTDNGTYILKATVVDGVVTTEWVLEA